MTAGDVMDRVASVYLNDISKKQFSYQVLIPHLNVAIDDLTNQMASNNVTATNETSVATTIAPGTITLAPPADLVEIQELWERPTGTTQDFLPMVRVEFLPKFIVPTSNLIYWEWNDQVLKFVGANTNVDVKLDYIGATLPKVTSKNDAIALINSMSFLAFRTAALAARYIGENPERAAQLDSEAGIVNGVPTGGGALGQFLDINIKGKQAIQVRRRPFRAAWKMINGGW